MNNNNKICSDLIESIKTLEGMIEYGIDCNLDKIKENTYKLGAFLWLLDNKEDCGPVDLSCIKLL